MLLLLRKIYIILSITEAFMPEHAGRILQSIDRDSSILIYSLHELTTFLCSKDADTNIMTTTSPHLTDETPHAIELNPYPNLYSELPSPHRYGRQSFENEEVGETLLTPDSQPPKLTQNTFAAPLERTYRALATWIIGPQPPRLYTIHPAFTYRQLAPPKLLKKFGSKQIQSSWLLGINLAWVICFPTILVDRCRTLDNKPPVRLSCVSRFW